MSEAVMKDATGSGAHAGAALKARLRALDVSAGRLRDDVIYQHKLPGAALTRKRVRDYLDGVAELEPNIIRLIHARVAELEAEQAGPVVVVADSPPKVNGFRQRGDARKADGEPKSEESTEVALLREWEAAKAARGADAPKTPAAGGHAGQPLKPLTDDDVDDEILATVIEPIDVAAFYGPLRDLVDAATVNSEATKVGVAMCAIANVSTLLRPFFVPLGDEMLPLNVYMTQVGPAARGRKGTSAKAAAGVFPAARDMAAKHRAHVAATEAVLAAAQRRFFDAEERRSRSLTFAGDLLMAGPKGHAEADAQVVGAEAALTEIEGRIATWQKKLKKGLSPRARREYQQALDEATTDLVAAKKKADDARAWLAVMGDWTRDPVGAQARADAEVEAALKEMNDATAAVDKASVEPWRRVLAEMAEGPHVLRGVASGEGIIDKIRDGRVWEDEQGRKRQMTAVKDKRMLIDLDELGSVFSLVRRQGSTLSSVIRAAYDCAPLETNSKVAPVSCKEPWISICASITPAELVGMLFDSRDASAQADNGFGNRLLFMYAARDKLVALPVPSSGLDAICAKIAANIEQVVRTLQPAGGFKTASIEMSAEAAQVYSTSIYEVIDGMQAASPNAAKLYGRLTTNLRKIAAVVAIMNGETEVSVGAVRAAEAWVRYAARTIDAVASTVADRVAMRAVAADAGLVLAALHALAPTGGVVAQREVRRKARLDEARMKASVIYLMQQAPSPIRVEKRETPTGNGTRRTDPWLGLSPPAAVAAIGSGTGENDDIV